MSATSAGRRQLGCLRALSFSSTTLQGECPESPLSLSTRISRCFFNATNVLFNLEPRCLFVCVRACLFVYLCACVRACLFVCVRACARMCGRVFVCAGVSQLHPLSSGVFSASCSHPPSSSALSSLQHTLLPTKRTYTPLPLHGTGFHGTAWHVCALQAGGAWLA